MREYLKKSIEEFQKIKTAGERNLDFKTAFLELLEGNHESVLKVSIECFLKEPLGELINESPGKFFKEFQEEFLKETLR